MQAETDMSYRGMLSDRVEEFPLENKHWICKTEPVQGHVEDHRPSGGVSGEGGEWKAGGGRIGGGITRR
jgi:hypothetical protein